MAKLETYRKSIPWSRGELARQAGLDRRTIEKAERGEPIQPRSAEALIEALSRGLNQTLRLSDIDGLQVRAID